MGGNTSWDGCPTFPGEPCGTDFDCGDTGGTGGGTGGGGTYTCPPVYTDGCPVYTNGCASDSVCPQGVYCY